MFAAIILVRREVFEIRTPKYLGTLVIPHKIRTFSSYKVNDFIFQLCTCSRMCLLLNWQTWKL